MVRAVVINDVGPRDGLQNQAKILSPDERLKLIDALRSAGIENIEVGAFVSPKAVPAMAGAEVILAGLVNRDRGDFSVLIPNMKGYELATAAGATHVNLVVYASDGMARANVKMQRAEVDEMAAAILKRAQQEAVRVTVVVAVAFECPFDGPTAPTVVEEISRHFLDLGADQLVLADTIGAANPLQVKTLTAKLVTEHGTERLGCHFHDTRAMGLTNVFAALESGIRNFDASIGGLGGCPFAPGASGNVATEDVVMMLQQMDYETEIDMAALLKASNLAAELTGNAPGGKAKPWLVRQQLKAS